MPQAALAFAVWVGSSAAFAAAAAGAGTALAATVGFATIGATLAAEAYAVVKVTETLTPKIKDPGTTLQWQADPRAGIPYPMGRCAVGGNIVFNQSAGGNGKYLNFVSVYSGVPADAFEAFQANGVTVSFTADGGEGASGYYLNRMWLKTQLGSANDPYLHWTATGSKDTPADHGGMPWEWTPAHKLSGYAAALLAMEYDTKRYASGVPTPRMIGRWAKTYDPRQDSTYPGGSGLHRWNNEATWTWSRCMYRNALAWCIGRRNGNQLALGIGYDISEIDVPAFVNGMNVSDANGWTMGGQVSSTDDKWEVLKAILQAGAGYPILGGTKVSVMVNAPSVSLATITDADIVGAMTVPAQVTAQGRINTVWPSYTEEALDWQVVTPDAPVQVAEYVATDGEERSIELGLPLVQDATQIGQLCRYAIEDARELNSIVLQCKPWTMWLAPGNCITVNSPEAGLNGQKLRIQKRTRDPQTKVVTFICRTETDGKHAFALGQTNVPPATPALTGVDANVVPLPAEDAWGIVGGVVAGESGSLPGIVIAGEVDLYDAVSIIVDYRKILPTVGDWKSASFPASSRTLVVQGVEPGATYQVRIRYITARGVENPASNVDLGDIVVGGVGAGSLEGRPGQAILDDLDINALNTAATDLRQGSWRSISDVEIDGVRTAVDQLGEITEEHTVFITFMQSVDGVTGVAKRVVAVNSDGHIIGQVDLNDGTIGSTSFVDDIFEIVAATGPPIKVFQVNTLTGRVRFRADVEIDGNLSISGSFTTRALAANAVSNRIRGALSSSVAGTGSAVTEFSYTFTLPSDADVEVDGDVNFQDGGGNGPSYHSSAIRLTVNGTEVGKNVIAGAMAMQKLDASGGQLVSAGSCTVTMTVMTKPDDSYDARNIRIRWFYK